MVLTEFACCWLSTLHYAGTVVYLWPEFPPVGRAGVTRQGLGLGVPHEHVGYNGALMLTLPVVKGLGSVGSFSMHRPHSNESHATRAPSVCSVTHSTPSAERTVAPAILMVRTSLVNAGSRGSRPGRPAGRRLRGSQKALVVRYGLAHRSIHNSAAWSTMASVLGSVRSCTGCCRLLLCAHCATCVVHQLRVGRVKSAAGGPPSRPWSFAFNAALEPPLSTSNDATTDRPDERKNL